MRATFLQQVQRKVLLADGAMGTELIAAGLPVGECGDHWNLTQSEAIAAIHRTYVAAGADLLLTNSFQASSAALFRHGLSDRTYEINLAAARIARDCIGGQGFVLGDIGPFGGFLSPLGTTQRSDLRSSTALQVWGLLDGGVDGFIVETMTSMEELATLADAIRDCRPGLPIVGSLTFDRLADGAFRTMTGVDVPTAVASLERAGVDILGCNCGTGIHVGHYIELVAEFRRYTDRPLMVQPNAGRPRLDRGRIVYDESAETMADAVPALVHAGASIVGGCCGTTADHIRRFRAKLDELQRVRAPGSLKSLGP